MNLYKPGTKVRILKWDGSTGAYGDPTGRVGYISGDGRSVWSNKGGKGEYYCMAGSSEMTSEVEVIKEESMTNKVTRDNLKKDTKEVYKKDGIPYAMKVVERLTIDGEEYVVTRETDDGTVRIAKPRYLEHWGWELKSEQEETVVSIEEIARKFGVDTDKLRIKE